VISWEEADNGSYADDTYRLCESQRESKRMSTPRSRRQGTSSVADEMFMDINLDNIDSREKASVVRRDDGEMQQQQQSDPESGSHCTSDKAKLETLGKEIIKLRNDHSNIQEKSKSLREENMRLRKALDDANKRREPRDQSETQVIGGTDYQVITEGPNIGKLLTRIWTTVIHDGKYYKQWTILYVISCIYPFLY
jgi:predicted nuclease with TOPRIM domain